MSTDSAAGQVEDNAEQHRYELRVDGAVAGFVEYRLRPGRIVFTHAEVDPASEGKGVGSALVRGALDRARAEELRVTPLCPFVKSYIDRHAEYQDLVEAP